MPRQRIVKYPPYKPGQLSKAKIERAVKEVLEARSPCSYLGKRQNYPQLRMTYPA